MTLMDRLNALNLRAVAADNENQIKARSGEFVQMTEQVTLTTKNATEVESARSELRSAGIEQEGYGQLREETVATANDLISTLRSLPVSAKLDTVKSQVKSVERFFSGAEQWVEREWKGILETDPPAIDEALLDALRQSGVDVEDIRSEIERGELALLSLRNRKLPRVGDLARLRGALQTLNESSKKVGQVVDPIVADVLVESQGEGAPLASLTSPVLSELKRLKILDRFKVVLR